MTLRRSVDAVLHRSKRSRQPGAAATIAAKAMPILRRMPAFLARRSCCGVARKRTRDADCLTCADPSMCVR